MRLSRLCTPVKSSSDDSSSSSASRRALSVGFERNGWESDDRSSALPPGLRGLKRLASAGMSSHLAALASMISLAEERSTLTCTVFGTSAMLNSSLLWRSAAATAAKAR